MTREEAIVKFRQMWNIIAEIPEEELEVISYNRNFERIKKCALHKMGEKDDIKNSCYLCEYNSANMCRGCIVKWSYATGQYACERGGEYGDWVEAIRRRDYTEAKRIAKIIANLPEVEHAEANE